jgi:hypothetical protein
VVFHAPGVNGEMNLTASTFDLGSRTVTATWSFSPTRSRRFPKVWFVGDTVWIAFIDRPGSDAAQLQILRYDVEGRPVAAPVAIGADVDEFSVAVGDGAVGIARSQARVESDHTAVQWLVAADWTVGPAIQTGLTNVHAKCDVTDAKPGERVLHFQQRGLAVRAVEGRVETRGACAGSDVLEGHMKKLFIALGLMACSGGRGAGDEGAAGDAGAGAGGAEAPRDLLVDLGMEDEAAAAVERCAPERLVHFGSNLWAMLRPDGTDAFAPSCGGAAGLDAAADFTAPTAGRWRFTLEGPGGAVGGVLAVQDSCDDAGSERACEPAGGTVEVEFAAGASVVLVADDLRRGDSYVLRAAPVALPEGADCHAAGADACRSGARCLDPQGVGQYECVPQHAPVLSWVEGFLNPETHALGITFEGDDPEGDAARLQLLALDADGNGESVRLSPGHGFDRSLELGRSGTGFHGRAALRFAGDFVPVRVQVSMLDLQGLESEPVLVSDFQAPSAIEAGVACDPVGAFDACPTRAPCSDAEGPPVCTPVVACVGGPETIDLAEHQSEAGWRYLGRLGAGPSLDQGTCGGFVQAEATFAFVAPHAGVFRAVARGAGENEGFTLYARRDCRPNGPELACAGWPSSTQFEAGPDAPVFLTVDGNGGGSDFELTVLESRPTTVDAGVAYFEPVGRTFGIEVSGTLAPDADFVDSFLFTPLDAAGAPLFAGPPLIVRGSELEYFGLGYAARFTLQTFGPGPVAVRVAAVDPVNGAGPGLDLPVQASPALAPGERCEASGGFGTCPEDFACLNDPQNGVTSCTRTSIPVILGGEFHIAPAQEVIFLALDGMDAEQDVETLAFELIDSDGRPVFDFGDNWVGWQAGTEGEGFRVESEANIGGLVNRLNRIAAARAMVIDRAGNASNVVEIGLTAAPELPRGAVCTANVARAVCAEGDVCHGVVLGTCELWVPPVPVNPELLLEPALGRVAVRFEFGDADRLLGGAVMEFLDADGAPVAAGRADGWIGRHEQAYSRPDVSVLAPVAGPTRHLFRFDGAAAWVERVATLRLRVVDWDLQVGEPVEVTPSIPSPLEPDALCGPGSPFDRCPEGMLCAGVSPEDPDARCAPRTPPRILEVVAMMVPEVDAIGEADVLVHLVDDGADPRGLVFEVSDFAGRVHHPFPGEDVPLADGTRIEGDVSWLWTIDSDRDGSLYASARLLLWQIDPVVDVAALTTLQVQVVDAAGTRSEAVSVALEADGSGVEGELCLVFRRAPYCAGDSTCMQTGVSGMVGTCGVAVTECPAAWPVVDLNANAVGGGYSITGGNAGSGLWFRGGCNAASLGTVHSFVAPRAGTYTFATERITGNTVLLVRSHCGVHGAQAEIACDDDSGGNDASLTSVDLEADAQVYVIVLSANGSEVSYDLVVRGP